MRFASAAARHDVVPIAIMQNDRCMRFKIITPCSLVIASTVRLTRHDACVVAESLSAKRGSAEALPRC
jgi:hypothetical protein